MDQTESDFTINYKLVNLPKYIFVGLKRFRCTQTYIQKIISPIEIPFETSSFDSKLIYELKGFIIHQGGVLGGHYYAYGKRKINGESKWFCFNDSNVSEVDIQTITNESSQAYVLLYGRK
jgi:ubiquitin C-terminal hydrolase